MRLSLLCLFNEYAEAEIRLRLPRLLGRGASAKFDGQTPPVAKPGFLLGGDPSADFPFKLCRQLQCPPWPTRQKSHAQHSAGRNPGPRRS